MTKKLQTPFYLEHLFAILCLCAFLGSSCADKGSVPHQVKGQRKTSIPGLTPTPIPTERPPAPTLNFPQQSTYYSATKNLNLSGNCNTENNVILSGASSDSLTCIANAFAFVLSQTEDGSYNYGLRQISKNKLASDYTYFTWILDSIPPTHLRLITPTSNELINNQNNLYISGYCEETATIIITSNAAIVDPSILGKVPCHNGKFSYTITKTNDGIFNFILYQQDLAGNNSTSTQLKWTRDTTIPTSLRLVNPIENPYISGDTKLKLSGLCENNATVFLSGSSSDSVLCDKQGQFEFTLSKETDGTYNFSLSQTDQAANISTELNFTWTRTSQLPVTPVIVSPTSNPFYSKTKMLNLVSSCEANYIVNLTEAGDSLQQKNCPEQAPYQVSFDVNKTIDGDYHFELAQNNGVSFSNKVNFSWLLDTLAPAMPLITKPKDSNFFSNTNLLTIEGSCESGLALTITGDLVIDSTCPSSGNFAFLSEKSTDSKYNYYISQSDFAGNTSTVNHVTWTRDTLTPSVPTITHPEQNPYTSRDNTISLSGTCEPNAQVTISSDSGDETETILCNTNASYNFTLIKVQEGQYSFTVTQTDNAGNTSISSAPFQWNRVNTLESAPVLISPTTLVHYTNSNNLQITLACEASDNVNILGVLSNEVLEPAKQLTQVCPPEPHNEVKFTINKTADGNYPIAFNQDVTGNYASATTSLQWIIDTLAPTTTITNKNSLTSTNFSNSITFTFNANEDFVEFQCALDSEPFSTCTSPVTLNFTATQNGQHIWQVKATDLATNTGSEDSFTWTQAQYDTIALYHFDKPSLVDDSSFFTSKTKHNNNINASNITSDSGKFKNAVTTAATSKLVIAHNPSQSLAYNTTTFEAFIKPNDFSMANKQKMVIASKMGQAGNYGWEFGLICLNNSGCTSRSQIFSLYLSASTSLTTVPVLYQSATFSKISTNRFKHVAFTLSAGIANFYFDGNLRGSATLGNGFANTTADLLIGNTNNNTDTNYANASQTNSNNTDASHADARHRSTLTSMSNKNTDKTDKVSSFIGSIDEVRWSQSVRYNSNSYTVPSQAFTVD